MPEGDGIYYGPRPDSVGSEPGRGEPTREGIVTGRATGQSTDDLSVSIAGTLDSIRKAFDKQFEYLENKEELWESYRTTAEELLENSPKYEIPNVVNNLVDQLTKSSTEIRDIYLNAGDELKSTVLSNLDKSLSTYNTGLSEMVKSVQSGGSDSLKTYEDAYNIATQGGKDLLNAVKDGNMDVLNTAGNYANLMQNAAEGNVTKFDQSAKDILNTYSQGAGDLLAKGAGYSSLMTQFGSQAANIYNTESSDVVNQYRAATGAAGQASQQALGSQLTGAGNILSLAQQRAQQDMPGMSLLQDKLGSQTAEAVRRIKEYGGGSQASLGAVSDLYASQQRQLQDLAIQNVQYRDYQQQNLQNTYGTVAGMQAGAYGQFGQESLQQADVAAGAQERMMANRANAYNNLSGTIGSAGQFDVGTTQAATGMLGGAQQDIASQQAALGQYLTNTYGQGGQMQLGAQQYTQGTMANAMQYGQGMQLNALQDYGQMQNLYGNQMGQAYQNYAQGLGGAYQNVAGMQGNTISAAAGLQGSGINQAAQYGTQAGMLGANYADQAYQYNTAAPYQANLAYNQAMIGQTDPTAYQMGYYGDTAGMNYSLYQGNINQQMANQMINAQMWSGAMQGLGSMFQGSGTALIGGLASLLSSKDYKNSIEDNKYDSIEILNNLKVKNFKYNPEFNVQKEMVGIIVEESPDILISDNKKSIDGYTLIGLLIDNIQKLNKDIEELKNK